MHCARRRQLLAAASTTLLPTLGRPARAAALAPLRLVSGDLPPFAIEGRPEQPGVLAELAEQLLQRAGQPAKTEFYPWARALQMASSQPRIAILPLTRTPEREPRFQWLVKLYVQHFVLINRAGEAPLESLEQARRLRITLLRGSPNLAQLQRRGFDDTLILQASSVEDMLRLLERGHADALYGGELINMDKVRSSGRDAARFQVGMTVESGDVWLASGSGVDEAERQLLQSLHREMLRDGSVERLFKAYGIKPRASDLR